MQASRRMRVLVSATLALLAARSAPGESAEPDMQTPLRLAWIAPDGCPSGADVEADVRTIMEGPPASEPTLEAEGLVWQGRDGQWRARLRTVLSGVRGERELSGSTCGDVARAASLVLALMLEPKPPSEPAPKAAAPPEKRSPPPSPSRPRRAPRRHAETTASARPEGLTRAAAVAGFGSMPGFEASAGLHLGVVRGWASLELRVAGWLPATAYSAIEPSAGADFLMFAVTPTGCARYGPENEGLRIDTCAGLGAAAMTARGFGMSVPGQASARWAVAMLEQAGLLGLSRHIGLRAAIAIVRPLSRPTFAIENLENIHRPRTFGLSGSLAGEVSY